MPISSYIENLFTYFERFETNPSQFDTEAFLQTYNGIYAVFQALRKERDRAVEIDQYFLTKIRSTPISKSDLRQITTQLLITYFEVESDVDGQSNQAYLYCRGQREVKQDVPYFESHVVPMLFHDAAMSHNFKLNTFFLSEIARYMNKYGSPLHGDITPEAFDKMSESSKFLLLERRRLEMGRDLATDRTTLEHHLMQVGTFQKMAGRGRIQRDYLSDWAYLASKNFWAKVSQWFRELFARIGGAFSSWSYFRLVLRQRNAAYFFYSIVIVVAILAAIYVPVKWLDHSGKQLQQLEQHASELQGGGGR